MVSSESDSTSIVPTIAEHLPSLRIPTKYVGGKEYQEKVWDHAPGSLLVTEAGGICTDMFGKPLDFSKGRTLSANEGIVAAGTDVHPKAVQAVTRALEEAKRVAV